MTRYSTIEEALAAARAENRDVLVDFSGSDWCGWCIRLNEEVFDTPAWRDTGAKRFLLVELDFPRRRQLPDSQRLYNERIRDQFGVTGFPTVFVLDSAGRAYARTGYQEGGPAEYLAHLDAFAPRKGEIGRLLADPDRAASLPRLLHLAERWEVEGAWLDLKEQIAETSPASPAGVQAAREAALAAFRRGDTAKQAKFVAIVRASDPAAADLVETAIDLERDIVPLMRQGDWRAARAALDPFVARKGEAGQAALYYAALCEGRLGNTEAAVALLERGVPLAPDSPTAARMNEALSQVRGG